MNRGPLSDPIKGLASTKLRPLHLHVTFYYNDFKLIFFDHSCEIAVDSKATHSVENKFYIIIRYYIITINIYE